MRRRVSEGAEGGGSLAAETKRCEFKDLLSCSSVTKE